MSRLVVLLGSREVGGGDLETVEEETGAAEVDVVGGDVLEDTAESVLDLVGALEVGKGGSVLSGSAFAESGDRGSGSVVVVAEFFSAHRRASAGSAFGSAVTAGACLGFGACLADFLDHLGRRTA
ncbi:hypothetical protein JAO29_21235 [Edaphobacter sp. HDX4]|uniref:hypothetical protein n=1 Tax=Edaphobacter sp. HDX4 TaxID=2794064 RepID=UPI002FE6515F